MRGSPLQEQIGGPGAIDCKTYFDVHGLPARNIVKEIRQAVAGCRTLLVVVDPGWAEQRDEEGHPRLENQDDFVRLELETGLQREDVAVLPLLVAGAHMPKPHQLPHALRSLTEHRGLELHDSHWIDDIGRLCSPSKVDESRAPRCWWGESPWPG